MKNIFLLSIALLGLFACCKHYLPQPAEQPTPVAIDYYAPYLANITNYKLTHLNRSTIRFDSNGRIRIIPFGQYYKGGKLRYSPLFNPNNPYEIAYMEQYGGTRLYTFNFQTGEKRLVYDKINYGLSWSKKGWFLFTNGDYQLWKIKANGDSLTQLTNNREFNNWGTWLPNGEKFVYLFQQKIRICKEDGSLEKVIDLTPRGMLCWNDSILLIDNYRNIVQYNIHNDSQRLLKTGTGMGFPIVENGKLYSYHSSDQGVGQLKYYSRYDYATQMFTTLDTLYDSYRYGITDYHPQTQKCTGVLDRRDYKDSTSCDIIYYNDLILMSPDGKDRKLIRIPD